MAWIPVEDLGQPPPRIEGAPERALLDRHLHRDAEIFRMVAQRLLERREGRLMPAGPPMRQSDGEQCLHPARLAAKHAPRGGKRPVEIPLVLEQIRQVQLYPDIIGCKL